MKTCKVLVKRLSITGLAAVLFLSSAALAWDPGKVQSQSGTKYKFTVNQIEQLKEGIKSENAGLRKSCIWYAGVYEVEETEELLIEQLESEKDPSVSILIAMALFKIGNDKGLDAIGQLSVSHSPEIKIIGAAVYDQLADELNKNNN